MSDAEYELVHKAAAILLMGSGFALILAALAELLEWIGHRDEQERNKD